MHSRAGPNRGRLLIALALPALVALALAGCKDRGETQDEGSGAQSTPQPGAQSAGSGTPSTPLAGAQRGTMKVGALERAYRLYVPKSLPTGGPAALVIGLHGGLGSGEQFAENSRFDAEAEAQGFLIAYPDGIGRTWNGGACCNPASRQNIDDVAFISALIDELRGRYDIDPKRVFVTGHSNGAIMAFRLACELSDKIAAIVPVAGSLEVPSCAPARPVAVLAIHGDADQNHPLQGGMGPNSIAGVDFQPLAASMESLRRANGCTASTESNRAGEVTTTVWQGCRAGGYTEQKIIAGAPHAWPGALRAGSAAGGTPTQALNATQEAWRFFAAHGRAE